jgi:hypothetical protein
VAEIELRTDFKFEPEHKKKCEECKHDKFYVFDDYENNFFRFFLMV